MSGQDAKLSPAASPNIMEVKTKRARRLNNRPMLILFAAFGIVSLTLGWVVVSRGDKAKADIGKTTVKSSDAFAKDLTSEAEAGMVNPPPPPPPVAPPPRDEPPPKTDDAPKVEPPPPDNLPDAKAQAAPRMTEEARKMREKRWRQVEAAIDGPIKAQIDDVKTTPRAVSAELAAVERQLAALGNTDAQSYTERLAAIRAALDGGSGATDYSRRGDLSRMNQFGDGTDWTNPASVEAPPVMHIIRTGSVIPATLVSGINSDLPGQIVGQVAQDVYDTPTGKHILIPQGSRLVGEYSADVQYGQSRVFAVWQRVVFPDGKALDLGAMPGSSGAGYSGFRDRVNNHYVRIFGSAIMMSAILAGVEMTQNNQDYNQGSNQQRMSDAMSEALGNQLGGVMAEMLQKNMNIAPALEIRPGYRFNVMLVKDLVFSGPYDGFDYARR